MKAEGQVEALLTRFLILPFIIKKKTLQISHFHFFLFATAGSFSNLLKNMFIYVALLSILLLHGIIGKTEWGFKMFSKYEPGNMSLIISSPHDGKINPLKQENGDPWPDRWPGCVGSDGCVWKHNCGKPDNETCTVIAYNDAGAAMVARDIADGIRALTGKEN